jgi:hypothetical protein
LTGQKVDAKEFYRVNDGCYSYANILMSEGLHSIKGAEEFGVFVYGYGDADSYGYTGGMAFRNSEEILPSISEDVEICLGDSADIYVKDFASVKWYMYSDKVISTDSLLRVSPEESTTYRAELFDDMGCLFTRYVDVVVNPNPIVILDDTVSICKGNTKKIEIEGGEYYIWDDSPDLSCTKCASPIVSPDKPTWYYVTAYNEFSCKTRDSIFIDFYPDFIADAGKDTTLCKDGIAQLSASGGEEYFWDEDPTLSCTECQSPEAKPSAKSIYYVTVYDKNNCLKRDSVIVDIFDDFKLDFQYQNRVCYSDTCDIRVSGAEKYKWYPEENLSCDTCDVFYARVYENKKYYVLATDKNGCERLDSIEIELADCSLECEDIIFPLDVYCLQAENKSILKKHGGIRDISRED